METNSINPVTICTSNITRPTYKKNDNKLHSNVNVISLKENKYIWSCEPSINY